jgi:hypothetical protein
MAQRHETAGRTSITWALQAPVALLAPLVPLALPAPLALPVPLALPAPPIPGLRSFGPWLLSYRCPRWLL